MKSMLLAGVSLATVATVFPATSASAQDGTVEEIIVTARLREATLLETPVAITAVGGETLDIAQTRDIRDIQTLVPTLQVSTFAGASNTSFSIRGIGSSTFNFGIEPAVGVFVDGVYRSRNGASISDFLGLERVEVLRGPQSTLFGKNTTAGVISFVTKKPDFEYGAEGELTYGNYDARIAKLGVTGPIVEDVLAFRADGYVNQRDGFLENTEGGDDLNERDRWGVRGQLYYTPSEDLEVRIIADYNDIAEACCAAPFTTIGEDATPVFDQLGITRFGTGDAFNQQIAIDGNVLSEIETWGVSADIKYQFEDFAVNYIAAWRNYNEVQDIDADFTNVEINRQRLLNQRYDAHSQEIRFQSTGDGAFEWMAGAYYFNQDLIANERNQQGNFIRPFADGLFNFDVIAPEPVLSPLDPFFAAGVPLPGGGALPGFTTGGSLVSLIEGLNGLPAGTYFAPGFGIQRARFDQENQTYGLFASGDWHVTDRLTISGGLRYTIDERDLVSDIRINDPFAQINLLEEFAGDYPIISQIATTGAIVQAGLEAGLPLELASNPAVNPGFANFAAIQASVDAALQPGLQAGYAALSVFQLFPQTTNVSGDRSDEDLSGNIIVSYDVDDDTNVYASYSTGFKGGGFALAATAARVGDFTFDPETTTAFELGAKARWMDGRLQTNVAVFWQEIEDFQANVFTGTAFVPDNAGSIEVSGLEFDMEYRPTENWLFTAAGAYLWQREYGEFPNAPCPSIIPPDVVCTPTFAPGSPVPVNVQDLGGQEVSGSAEFRGSLTGMYMKNLGNGYEMFIRGELAYTSEVFLTTELDPRQVQGDFALLAASAGFGPEDGSWQLQIWSRNLTDTEYLQGSFNSTIPGGNLNGYPGDPFTFGGTIRFNF